MPFPLIRPTNNHGLDFTNSQNQHCSGKALLHQNTGLDRSDHFHQFVTIHAKPSKPTEWPVILRNRRNYPYSILIGLIHAHFGACQCSSPFFTFAGTDVFFGPWAMFGGTHEGWTPSVAGAGSGLRDTEFNDVFHMF